MKNELSDDDIIIALRECYLKDMLKAEEAKIQRKKSITRWIILIVSIALIAGAIYWYMKTPKTTTNMPVDTDTTAVDTANYVNDYDLNNYDPYDSDLDVEDYRVVDFNEYSY